MLKHAVIIPLLVLIQGQGYTLPFSLQYYNYSDRTENNAQLNQDGSWTIKGDLDHFMPLETDSFFNCVVRRLKTQQQKSNPNPDNSGWLSEEAMAQIFCRDKIIRPCLPKLRPDWNPCQTEEDAIT